MKKIKAHLICHTHWDREWYLTREQFTPRLVRLVDSVLDIIETIPDFVSFMLDGQFIVLEDYLEIRPRNLERIVSAIRSGRLIAGPWYVLPDEVLVSGESHIRNYLLGQQIGRKLGGSMKTGYLPDSFGHPEQMPQIIKGLGMEEMIFWRGIPLSIEEGEFWWESAYRDAKIVAINMPRGYGNSAVLDNSDIKGLTARLERMIESLNEKTTTNITLIMNGSDHILGQEDIGKIIEAFNEESNAATIEFSTMENYVKELRENLQELPTYKGELRSGDRSMLLGGTVSARTYLKQENAIVQRNMERYLEPIAIIDRLQNNSMTFSDYQSHLWKKILENHPHDSICGCSVDKVHNEMLTRFDCTKQLQETLIDDFSFSISNPTFDESQGRQVDLFGFNPNQTMTPHYLEIEADFDGEKISWVDFENSIIIDTGDEVKNTSIPKALLGRLGDGRTVEATLISTKKEDVFFFQDHTAPEVFRVNRCKVGLLLPALEYGTFSLHLLPTDEDNSLADNAIIQKEISNEFYTVSYDATTVTFNILNHATGKTYKHVNRIIDSSDAGDEYTYSWAEFDSFYTLENAQSSCKKNIVGDCLQQLIISSSLKIPSQLEVDRKSRNNKLVDCPVTITVSLFKNINRVDVGIVIDNQAKDHIIRVEFPCGVSAESSYASSAFMVTNHPVNREIPKTWMEYPFSTAVNHGFIAVGENNGLALAPDGIMEYQVENRNNQSYLQLTLMRSVGWLSRTDLLTRCANGGWSYETPEAQCLGVNSFNYSLFYYQNGWENDEILGLADAALHRPIVIQPTPMRSRLEITNPLAFISSLPDNIRLSAMKVAEDNNGTILRVYSTTSKSQKVCLKINCFSTAECCNLAEISIDDDFTFDNSQLEFIVSPYEIKSFRLN